MLNPLNNKLPLIITEIIQKDPHEIEVIVINYRPVTKLLVQHLKNNPMKNSHFKFYLPNVKIIHIQPVTKSWLGNSLDQINFRKIRSCGTTYFISFCPQTKMSVKVLQGEFNQLVSKLTFQSIINYCQITIKISNKVRIKVLV